MNNYLSNIKTLKKNISKIFNKVSEIPGLYLFKNKRSTIFALIFGYLFSFCLFMGATSVFMAATKLDAEGLTNGDLIMVFLNAFIPAFFFGELYLRLEHLIVGASVKQLSKPVVEFDAPHRRHNDREYYWICVGVLLLCFLPVFLAYYPGPLAYDIAHQLVQGPLAAASTNPEVVSKAVAFSTPNPLPHTLYMEFFYFIIGEKLLIPLGISGTAAHTFAIALSNILQMFIVALCCSLLHQLLYRLNLKKSVRIFLLLFNGLLPTISLMAITTTKDTLFSAFLVVLVTALCYFELAPDYKGRIPMLIIGLLMSCLMRHNGIYGVIIMLLVSSLHLLRQHRKNAITLITVTIVTSICYLGISNGLRIGLNARGGNPNEMLAIPYQQIACVYKHQSLHYSLSESDKQTILSFIPNAENYNPATVDSVKMGAHASDNYSNFFKLYLQLLVRYPGDYIQSFLDITRGYWYFMDDSYTDLYGATIDSRSGCLLTGYADGFEVIHKSLLPPLETVYERLFSNNSFLKIFLLRLLISPALYFWAIILPVFYGMENKQNALVTPTSLVLAIILTYLAGPCALLRYALPYILCVPAIWAMLMPSNH